MVLDYLHNHQGLNQLTINYLEQDLKVGQGSSLTYFPPLQLVGYTGDLPQLEDYYSLPNHIPPAVKYFNVGMVFDSYTSSELSSGEKIICEDLIKSKLSRCGNPNNWTQLSGTTNKDKCRSCFNGDDLATSRGLCENFPNLISGSETEGTLDPNEVDYRDEIFAEGGDFSIISKRLGVCGVLSLNQIEDIKTPWDFIDVTHEQKIMVRGYLIKVHIVKKGIVIIFLKEIIL